MCFLKIRPNFQTGFNFLTMSTIVTIQFTPDQFIGVLLSAYEAGNFETEQRLGILPGNNQIKVINRFYQLLENSYNLKIATNEKT